MNPTRAQRETITKIATIPTVDLYVGDIIKGFPDMKLIIEKKED